VKRVLLVDDDQRFTRAVARELALRGFQVDEAADGLAAIERALEEPPDVAVVDLVMPRVGGSQVIGFFRQHPSLARVPIVVLSGVLGESALAVERLDVDLVMAKGQLEETAWAVCAGIEGLGQTGRGARVVGPGPKVPPRRQVVELLARAEELGAVLEGAAAGVLELDPRGRVLRFNTRAVEVLGIDAASLVGTDIVAVFPRAGRARLQTVLARFAADQGPATRTLTAATDDGGTVRATVASLWSDGAARSLVLTLVAPAVGGGQHDRPGRLLQYLVHELRASLLIMEEHLRTIAPEGAGGTGPAAVVEFLSRETARLRRLLDDASQIHHTLGEIANIDLEPMDPVATVKDSLSGISALAVPQAVEVTYRGPASAPKVRGDRDRLLQALYNLLLNALQATPRGGSIRVELEVIADTVGIAVVDSGRGMDSEALREVLAEARRPELFLPGRSERGGLGLSVAHQIAQAHGGWMVAESAPGAGSRFGLVLPIWAEAPGAAGGSAT